MRLRVPLLVLLTLLTAATARAVPFDHHDPAALVARAKQAIGEGALRDACVLLSRAGQLAPHDARVAIAWGEWEAAMNGVPAAPSAPPVPVAPPAQVAAPTPPRAVEVAPEPPAPWPVR